MDPAQVPIEPGAVPVDELAQTEVPTSPATAPTPAEPAVSDANRV
jgi:hypothetical protein